VSLPTLTGGRLTLRPATGADAAALDRIAAAPEVARWVGGYDIVDGQTFTIEVDGEVAGWLNAEAEEHPEYRHVALDIFIAAPLHGRGFGPEALRMAIRHFIEQGHHRFTIDPETGNERAIKAYASVGFKRVGVMRDYERHASGEWHDNLLMDLLAEELISPDRPARALSRRARRP
jgi:aminoglycoside 6'-N-acetyltransferase